MFDFGDGLKSFIVEVTFAKRKASEMRQTLTI